MLIDKGVEVMVNLIQQFDLMHLNKLKLDNRVYDCFAPLKLVSYLNCCFFFKYKSLL